MATEKEIRAYRENPNHEAIWPPDGDFTHSDEYIDALIDSVLIDAGMLPLGR